MTYHIKEIYYTLQGEGVRVGTPAVFCRFAGCNLWSGREEDRADAVCSFCDTDFVGVNGPGGGQFSTANLVAEAVAACWPSVSTAPRAVVCTGGEPLLQLDGNLLGALHQHGFVVAVETNGTVVPPPGIDWITVSPKARATLALTTGNELKLVFPQAGVDPAQFLSLEFEHFLLQPMDGPEISRHTHAATAYCLSHPEWRLSLQVHKMLGIP